MKANPLQTRSAGAVAEADSHSSTQEARDLAAVRKGNGRGRPKKTKKTKANVAKAPSVSS